MKVLVTGGAGFIGSHLVDLLLSEGHRVYVLDNFSTGSWENLPRNHHNLSILQGSVCFDGDIRPLVGLCEHIYHLAAVVGVKKSFAEPINTLVTNIRGAEKVLSYCAIFEKRVLIVSSSEIYGYGNSDSLITEEDVCSIGTNSLRWGYGVSKLADEFLALSFYKEKGVKATVVRPFNTVGPRQVSHYGMVLPRFIDQARQGKPITVYGDGTQSRCFGYVGEVARAFYDLMNTDDAVGKVFNVSGAEEISIQGLAEKVKRVAGSESEIVNIPYEEAYGAGFDDSMRRVATSEKLADTIGWKPSMSLEVIIRKILANATGEQ